MLGFISEWNLVNAVHLIYLEVLISVCGYYAKIKQAKAFFSCILFYC